MSTLAWLAATTVLVLLLMRSRRHLASLEHENRRLRDQSAEVAQLKKDFVSYVSHELKAPLASMQETTQLLLERIPGPLTDKQNRLLVLNLQSGRKLAAMIGDVLDMSRLEASLVDYDMQEQDLAEVILGVVADHRAEAQERGVELAVQVAEPLPVRCDGTRANQLITKVLENALRFSARGRTVRVAANLVTSIPEGMPHDAEKRVRARSSGREFVLVSIADGGPGIDDRNKEDIFNTFHGGRHARKTRGQGLGLGLPIARVVAEAHGGAIWVEDNPEGGSIFKIVLPASNDQRLSFQQAS